MAVRPVPANDPQPIRQLLRGFGGRSAAADIMEFIVRADDGATLSVVQTGRPALRPGARVGILRRAPVRITAAPSVLAAR